MTYDALGRMVEQNKSGTYSEIVYSPFGAKLAIMQGTTLQKAFVGLSGGTAAVYNSSGLAFYRHSDWLGSSRLASTSTRTVYYDGAYGPFGEQYANSGTTDLSFTGMNQDTASNVYDFPAREYGIQGRWPSPDPGGLSSVHIKDPQTWDRYVYVRNNPMALADSTGLDPGDDDGCDSGDIAAVRHARRADQGELGDSGGCNIAGGGDDAGGNDGAIVDEGPCTDPSCLYSPSNPPDNPDLADPGACYDSSGNPQSCSGDPTNGTCYSATWTPCGNAFDPNTPEVTPDAPTLTPYQQFFNSMSPNYAYQYQLFTGLQTNFSPPIGVCGAITLLSGESLVLFPPTSLSGLVPFGVGATGVIYGATDPHCN